MRLCPHCANLVEETAVTCPFCKAALESERPSRQRSRERADFPREREFGIKDRSGRLRGYLLVAVILAAAVFFTGRSLMRSNDFGAALPMPEEHARELEETNKQITRLDDQIAQLRKELEESSRRVAQLEIKFEEAAKALSSAEQKLKSAPRAAERSAPAVTVPREREVPQPTDAVPIPRSRRPAEAGTYEVIRTTEVFEEPSELSRNVSTIKKGTRVSVVRSVGEWLEVRSKHGNPPGFVRQDDAMFMEKD